MTRARCPGSAFFIISQNVNPRTIPTRHWVDLSDQRFPCFEVLELHIHHVRKMEANDPFDIVGGMNGLTGAAGTILVLKRQSSNVILYARGRDIDEKETTCTFDKHSCRWMLLGDANEVSGSRERSQIVEVLCQGSTDGMHISEIMAGTGRRDRNGLDQLLFKMVKDEEIVRVKRGV